MEIEQEPAFRRAFKRLAKADVKITENAIRAIVANPEIGEMKHSDLAGIRVYKFRMNRQLTLLAYRYEPLADTLSLMTLGSHENFYGDLKH